MPATDFLADIAVTETGQGFPYQDYVVIAGIPSPGKAIIKNLKHPSGLDERKGYGLSGATVIFTGDTLATFDIEFQLWAASDWPLWKAFYQLCFAKVAFSGPGGLLPFALTISHPVLEQVGVTEVFVVDRGAADKDEYGLW